MKMSLTDASRRLAIVGAASLLAACAATTPVADVEALRPVRPTQSRVVLFYPGRLMMADLSPRVEFDRAPVGELKSGTFLVVDVKPGPHVVRLWKPKPTWGGLGMDERYDIVSVGGATGYMEVRQRFRVSPPAFPAGGHEVVGVPEAHAVAQLTGLKRGNPAPSDAGESR
jgi:hypothetical protein